MLNNQFSKLMLVVFPVHDQATTDPNTAEGQQMSDEEIDVPTSHNINKRVRHEPSGEKRRREGGNQHPETLPELQLVPQELPKIPGQILHQDREHETQIEGPSNEKRESSEESESSKKSESSGKSKSSEKRDSKEKNEDCGKSESSVKSRYSEESNPSEKTESGDESESSEKRESSEESEPNERSESSARNESSDEIESSERIESSEESEPTGKSESSGRNESSEESECREISDHQLISEALLIAHMQCDGNCQLQRNLLNLDKVIQIKPDCLVKERVMYETQKIVDTVVATMKKENPSLSFSVEVRGSMTNDLKVGRPDEIDYLLNIAEISKKESEGWLIINDSNEYHPDTMSYPYIHTNNNKGIENCFQVVRKSDRTDTRERMQIDATCTDLGLLEQDKKLGIHLSAAKVKIFFSDAVSSALNKLKSTTSSTAAGKPSVTMCTGGAMSKPAFILENIPFLVHVDITPCVCYDKEDGTVLTLVPSEHYNTWKLSNEDPPELKVPVVCQAVRIIKYLRDIIYQKISLTVSIDKCAAFHAVDQDSDGEYLCCWRLTDILDWYFRKVLVLQGVPPSYAILGSVVQQFRKDREDPSMSQSVCSLVVNAVKNFTVTNPDGKFLLHLSEESRKIMGHVEQSLIKVIIDNHHADWTKLLPAFYNNSATNVADDLQTRYSPVEQFSHPGIERLRSDSECSRDDDVTGVWRVYKVKTSDFASLLYEQYPLLEHEREMNREGREGLVSVRDLLNGRGDVVYVAVLDARPPTSFSITLMSQAIAPQKHASIQELLRVESAKIQMDDTSALAL